MKWHKVVSYTPSSPVVVIPSSITTIPFSSNNCLYNNKKNYNFDIIANGNNRVLRQSRSTSRGIKNVNVLQERLLLMKQNGQDDMINGNNNSRFSSTSSTQSTTSSSTTTTSTTRRSILSKTFPAIVAALTASTTNLNLRPKEVQAFITQDSEWPLWTALPVAPYNRRKTIRYQITDGVWAFDQLIGIYYVHVPIRMTVVTSPRKHGLLVYAPIAPTIECLSLLDELIDTHGPILDIILPSVAVEHKVNAGPFARKFPNANFYVTDKQYSFPLNLPNQFLGLPPWTQTLPQSSSSSLSSSNTKYNPFGDDFEHQVLTVKPGIGSMYQDVAMLHKPSKTLLVCDAIFAVNGTPPKILTEEEEYTRALLFHARDAKNETVPDTPSNRMKGWRRIVLLFNFFFPGSARADLGLPPILDALRTPLYSNGWGGWMPFTWAEETEEIRDFETFSNNGKPTILPIIQIILSRGTRQVKDWLNVVKSWDFTRVVPMHLDAPLDNVGPKEFGETFDLFVNYNNEDSNIDENNANFVRFCDEDVQFLRKAEEGPLSFSVYKTSLGPLRGKDGPCGLVRPSASSSKKG